ncbi:MAG TPA: sulfur transferase domain-containing protein, partial [Planctomycetota bacterium]|nr:sulfur transferase domain-containing protein [Planctomycetota bacterium]
MKAAVHPCFGLEDGVLAGGELSRRDLDRFARQDVHSIVDLREEGEPGQQLSPNVAAAWAHACALEYRRVSVSVDHLKPRHTDLFLQALDASPRPVYVQSANGQRAAAFLILRLALRQGLDASKAFARARQLDLPALS